MRNLGQIGRVFLSILIFKMAVITHAQSDLTINSFSAYAGQTNIVLQASDDITFTGGTLTLPSLPAGSTGQLTVEAGNEILVGSGTSIVGAGWSITMKAPTVDQAGTLQANSVGSANNIIEIDASQDLILEGTSAIYANGDPSGTSASPGGFVVLNAASTYSDAAGSTISVSGTAGGQNGIVEIFDFQAYFIQIQTTVSGAFEALVDPYDVTVSSSSTSTFTSYNYLDVNFNVNDLAAYSAIDLQALDDITLSTTWTLSSSSKPAVLSLTAGDDIALEDGYGISAGQDWSLNLTAGTEFFPTAGQPTPASGSYGIYLDGAAYIESLNGNINLWATNEVQVGWSGSSAGSGVVNSGSSSITTVNGGNISVTAAYGDVNTGSDPSGFDYHATEQYCTVDASLGGISSAAGGNVSISAGGDVISYLPSGTDAEDGGAGAFGSEAGNVTINAGGNVFGHYVLANGIGTITAGANVGQVPNSGIGSAFALSLISGDWNVNATNGSIYLQEVRNPNGVFDTKKGLPRNGVVNLAGYHLFNYGANATVNLNAGIGVELTDQNLPRPSDIVSSKIPALYTPIFNISAGSGSVVLDGNVILFPSPDQNLSITTTDGGSLSGTLVAGFAIPPQLLMSDSAQTRFNPSAADLNPFSATDHGSLSDEPVASDSDPVGINISGDMENLQLITTKQTQITVGQNMTGCSFSGQNLQSSDVTSINVAGQIYNASAYSFVTLSQGISNIPAGDLLPGETNQWDDIFTLAVNPTLLPAELTNLQNQNIPVSEWASDILQAASVFGEHGGQLVGINPGFVYDPTSDRLGFAGSMSSAVLSELSQQLTILHLVNGVPVIDPATGQLKTDTITWVSASALQTLYTESQGAPSPYAAQLGYLLGGPGQFDVTAGSISLGNSEGILSCGIYDQPEFGHYTNLVSITPEGATINVTVSGDLNTLGSTIASLDGGNVNVISTAGSMDLGFPGLLSPSLALGIYTTGGGNVNVTAEGDIDIAGSRIATFDGGNIFVESLTGNVNVGSGAGGLNAIDSVYLNPGTGQAGVYFEDVYGSGIIAYTLVPVPPGSGLSWPPNAATVPGNITVETPEGNIINLSAGILQESLSGDFSPFPNITLRAGTYPGYPGNIVLGSAIVSSGTVDLSANGFIGEPALNTSINQSPGGFVISWNASYGQLGPALASAFEIESSPDLVNWQVINPAITTTANGGLSFESPASTNSSCFYRVQWQ